MSKLQAVRAIRSDADLDLAHAQINALLGDERDSDQEEQLEILSVLVHEYESRSHSIEAPDPIEAIKLRLEDYGLPIQALQESIGPMSRVYEVLNRRRPLSLGMIRKLSWQLDLPADILIQPIQLQTKHPRRGRPKSSAA